MLATLRQRNFALLWLAGLISLTGNWMLSVALPVAVYEMTGSALAVGGMLLASTLPGILFSSFAGIYVDRWERRRTIVVINLLLAVSILPLLLVRSPEWLWLVYVVSFVQSALGKFFTPAENAMLPLLSDQKLLVSANALNALNNNLARLIGPALGGLVAPLLGLNGVVFIDVVTYVGAAILTAFINVTSHPGKRDLDAALASRSLLKEWVDGIQLIWRKPNMRILFLLNIPPAIGESVMYVLLVPFVTVVLQQESFHVGGLMSAQALGGLTGGMLIGWLSLRMKTSRLLGYSALAFGFVDLALFNYSQFFSGVALAYVLIFLAGPLVVMVGASFHTLIQTEVADSHRGRVYSTITLTRSSFVLVGIALTGLADEALGIVPVINVQAYAYMLVGIGALLLLRERAMNHAPIPAENVG
ncbi:MFS transporter [Phototrophicus methaneseepsis]|uniref:MFS transporter n=1 Tax=Phototrophicus methaneseepsis TaxID=2710758 RepID=A0A7S8E7Q5_9CHLR|nr:MFS transporter [Phototrophicus methaneseepsis]QPC81890.1 MFS transporter [Phototrophicus methaneseepsis]